VFYLPISVSQLVAQMGYHMDMGGGGLFWLWMVLIIVAAIVLVAVVLFAILRAGGPGHALHASQTEPPLDIARRRYASGEITAEEFERIKNDLKG
jgi:putative membrane protein